MMAIPLYILLDDLHLLNSLTRAGARLQHDRGAVLRLDAQGLPRHDPARARRGRPHRRRLELGGLHPRGPAAGAAGARGDRALRVPVRLERVHPRRDVPGRRADASRCRWRCSATWASTTPSGATSRPGAIVVSLPVMLRVLRAAEAAGGGAHRGRRQGLAHEALEEQARSDGGDPAEARPREEGEGHRPRTGGLGDARLGWLGRIVEHRDLVADALDLDRSASRIDEARGASSGRGEGDHGAVLARLLVDRRGLDLRDLAECLGRPRQEAALAALAVEAQAEQGAPDRAQRATTIRETARTFVSPVAR